MSLFLSGDKEILESYEAILIIYKTKIRAGDLAVTTQNLKTEMHVKKVSQMSLGALEQAFSPV